MKDVVFYLNPMTSSLFSEGYIYSKLLSQVEAMKMAKSRPAQWTPTLLALSSKGIKKAELDASEIIEWLETKNVEAPNESITKEDLIRQISSHIPRIKRIDLGNPSYKGWVNIKVGSRYTERLYVLSSERMVNDDIVDQILFEIDDLGFDSSPLMRNPNLVSQLEARLKATRIEQAKSYDFKHHHFSEKVKNHGKNLLAHSRFSIKQDLFFVEEIQSDWAQRGRINNWGVNYPKAPLVTDTEHWAGLVLRDLMQTAAQDENVKHFAWIRANMRNGGGDRSDDLATFYDTIIRKLAAKAIEKAGGKIEIITPGADLGSSSVLSFAMTDQVRECLLQPQPLYSLDQLAKSTLPHTVPPLADEELIKSDCQAMLGNSYTVRLVDRLYDVAAGREVAGRMLGSVVEISRRAAKPGRVAKHEAWHFAEQHFLFQHEREFIASCFGPQDMFGLRSRTIEAMRQSGMPQSAIDQCADSSECAAHAFSLWCDGQLSLKQPKMEGLFARVSEAFMRMCDWVSEAIYGHRVNNTEELFEALKSGQLAARANQAATKDDLSHDSPVAG